MPMVEVKVRAELQGAGVPTVSFQPVHRGGPGHLLATLETLRALASTAWEYPWR